MSEPDRSRTPPQDGDRDADRQSLLSFSRRTLLGAGAAVVGLFGVEQLASDGARAAGSAPGRDVARPDTGDGDDPAVTYTAVESPAPRIQFSGVSRLDDGRSVVDLPDHFGRLVDADADLIVQVTPYGGGALTVAERSTDRIVVETVDGSDDGEFALTVTGTRDERRARPTGAGQEPSPRPGGEPDPDRPERPDPERPEQSDPDRENAPGSGDAQPTDRHDTGDVPEPATPVDPADRNRNGTDAN